MLVADGNTLIWLTVEGDPVYEKIVLGKAFGPDPEDLAAAEPESHFLFLRSAQDIFTSARVDGIQASYRKQVEGSHLPCIVISAQPRGRVGIEMIGNIAYERICLKTMVRIFIEKGNMMTGFIPVPVLTNRRIDPIRECRLIRT